MIVTQMKYVAADHMQLSDIPSNNSRLHIFNVTIDGSGLGRGEASVDVVTLNRMVACSVVRRVVDIDRPPLFNRLAAISIHQLQLDPF
jgi:hypothetical protein